MTAPLLTSVERRDELGDATRGREARDRPAIALDGPRHISEFGGCEEERPAAARIGVLGRPVRRGPPAVVRRGAECGAQNASGVVGRERLDRSHLRRVEENGVGPQVPGESPTHVCLRLGDHGTTRITRVGHGLAGGRSRRGHDEQECRRYAVTGSAPMHAHFARAAREGSS